MIKVLVIVDVQNDFCPGGALGVPLGDEVVPEINKIVDDYDVVILTRDWHPADHNNFTTEHKGSKPLDLIDNEIIWPPHCVQDTEGAKLHAGLKVGDNARLFTKGDDRKVHPYSGFAGVDQFGTSLEDYIRQIKSPDIEVDVVGLATDYCVKDTAIDSANAGFKTRVLLKACRAINEFTEGDALVEMEALQIELVDE